MDLEIRKNSPVYIHLMGATTNGTHSYMYSTDSVRVGSSKYHFITVVFNAIHMIHGLKFTRFIASIHASASAIGAMKCRS